MPITFDENGEVVLTPYEEPEAVAAAGYADELFAQPEIEMEGEDVYDPTAEQLGTPALNSAASLGFDEAGNPSYSVGVNQSVSGFNPETFNYLQTKGARGYELERRNAANEATANAEQQYKSRAGINDAQKSATADIARIEGEKARIHADAAVQSADLTRAYHQDVEKIYTQGKLEADAAFNDYANLMQEIRATQINPAQMWDNMSGGQRFGTLASVFIHDFLGAKGIQTSTMSTINKAIDRNIDAQIANLNNKKNVAAGFKDIYNMVRERSESDIEAKSKLHGIMLNAFKDDVAAKLFGMDSELARSKGALAMSELDKELLNKMDEVRKWEDQKAQVRVNQYLEKRGQDTQASIARISAGVRLAEIEAAKQKPAFDPKVNELVVRSKEGTLGLAPDAKAREFYQNKIDGNDELIRGLARFNELHRTLGGTYRGMGSRFITNKDKAELNSLYNDMLSAKVKAMSGQAAGEKEVERLSKVITFDDFTTGLFSGENPAAYVNSAFGLRQIENEVAALKNGLIPFNDPNYAGGVAVGDYRETDKAVLSADMAGPTPLDKVDRIFGESEHSVNLNDVVEDQSPELIESWKNWHGDVKDTALSGKVTPAKKEIPQWFGQMHRLRTMATDPNEEVALRQKAIGKLFEVSQSGDNVLTKHQARAAASLLFEINDDLFRPEDAYEMRASDLLRSKVKKVTPTGVEESDYYSDYVNMINSAPGVE